MMSTLFILSGLIFIEGSLGVVRPRSPSSSTPQVWYLFGNWGFSSPTPLVWYWFGGLDSGVPLTFRSRVRVPDL